MSLSSCSMKWLFSSESGNINLHESLFFVVQNLFLNVEMDSTCWKTPEALGLYKNNHSNLQI
jgi:hypothetical protein